MNKFVIMGALGSGKSTQARLLAAASGLVHINVGEIFRWNIQHHTKLGARVQRLVASGRLVPDKIVDEVVRKRLDQHDWNFGFVLDGFPRNRRQAEFFLESYDVDRVVFVDIPDAVVLMRVMGRRLCARCGLDYNLILHRPVAPNVCDICHGPLAMRPEDGPDAIRVRLADYHSATKPILQLFRDRDLLVTVDGVKPPDEVHAEIRAALRMSAPRAESALHMAT